MSDNRYNDPPLRATLYGAPGPLFRNTPYFSDAVAQGFGYGRWSGMRSTISWAIGSGEASSDRERFEQQGVLQEPHGIIDVDFHRRIEYDTGLGIMAASQQNTNKILSSSPPPAMTEDSSMEDDPFEDNPFYTQPHRTVNNNQDENNPKPKDYQQQFESLQPHTPETKPQVLTPIVGQQRQPLKHVHHKAGKNCPACKEMSVAKRDGRLGIKTEPKENQQIINKTQHTHKKGDPPCALCIAQKRVHSKGGLQKKAQPAATPVPRWSSTRIAPREARKNLKAQLIAARDNAVKAKKQKEAVASIQQ